MILLRLLQMAQDWTLEGPAPSSSTSPAPSASRLGARSGHTASKRPSQRTKPLSAHQHGVVKEDTEEQDNELRLLSVGGTGLREEASEVCVVDSR